MSASLSPTFSLRGISLTARRGGGPSMCVSQEARTTGLASPVVSVEIKRTVTEAQRTLMLPQSR